MLKQACLLCKVVGALAIIGAWNRGLVGILQVNLVERIFGEATAITRVIYVLVGLSGIALLVSYFTVCPAIQESGRPATFLDPLPSADYSSRRRKALGTFRPCGQI